MVVIEVKNTKWLEVVYMVFVLTVIIVKVRENEKKIVMKKSSNDVNHGNVNINIVTARPREKLFNQNESDIRTSMQHLADTRKSA